MKKLFISFIWALVVFVAIALLAMFLICVQYSLIYLFAILAFLFVWHIIYSDMGDEDDEPKTYAD
jgi:fatty acid desaturase